MSAALGRSRPKLALAVLCLINFAAGIDVTIVNVALPTMSRLLGVNNADLQWIVDAYTLVAAGLLLAAGNLADRYGRRRWLSVGLIIFAATSAVAACATSAEALIAARAVMGLGAAIMYPTTLALITNIFGDTPQRAKAIGLWTAMTGLGVIAGPIAGGWLLQHFTWGSIFAINVPMTVLALAGTTLVVPESRDPAPPQIDLAGLLLSAIGLTTLTYSIIEAPTFGWHSVQTWVGFLASAVLLSAFLWHERRSSHPMLDLSFFDDRRFSAGSVAVTAVFLTLFGFVFVMTQYLQFVTKYTPFETGMRLLPLAISVAIACMLGPRLAGGFGVLPVVAAGLVIFAVGMACASTFHAHTPYALIAVVMAALGSGLGFTMPTATELIMGCLSLATAGVGSAVTGATRQLGGTFGVAIIGSVFASVYTQQLDRDAALFTEALPAGSGSLHAIGQSMAEAERVLGRLPQSEAVAVRAAIDAAFLDAMSVSCLLCAALALSAALIVVILFPSRSLGRDKGSQQAVVNRCEPGLEYHPNY